MTDQAMVPYPTLCPHCGVTFGPDVEVGMESTFGVDVTLFYSCPACGLAWRRWVGNSFYAERARAEVRAHNAGRLISSLRPLIQRHAADLTRIARQSGWKVTGWSVFLDATEPTHSVVRIVISDAEIAPNAELSRQYPASRMSAALGEAVSIMWMDHWRKRDPDAYGEFQPWPEEADDA